MSHQIIRVNPEWLEAEFELQYIPISGTFLPKPHIRFKHAAPPEAYESAEKFAEWASKHFILPHILIEK